MVYESCHVFLNVHKVNSLTWTERKVCESLFHFLTLPVPSARFSHYRCQVLID